MENSLISWCDHTQNFWIGCTKVSPGCANCYAETLDRNRFSKTLDGGTKDAPVCHWGPGAPRHRTGKGIWADPIRWDKIAKAGRFVEVVRDGKIIARGDSYALAKTKGPDGLYLIEHGDRVFKVRPRVFCSSLSDILDPEVDPQILAEALDVIRKCDGLDWLPLTKRPELWRERINAGLMATDPKSRLAVWLRQWLDGTVRPHVWFGATMEDQPRYDQRERHLAAIPARYRFISMEPMLGPIDMLTSMIRHSGREGTQSYNCEFHWVIVGGESGEKARPMHQEWARSIRDQCAQLGVAFHFKQWGEWVPWERGVVYPKGTESDFVMLNGSKYAPGNFTSPCESVMRVGKKDAGHLLDGVEHRAFPNDPCARDHDRDGNCDHCATAGGCFYGKGGAHAR